MEKQRSSRRDPLLPVSIDEDRRGGTNSNGGRCALITLLFMPLLGCSMILCTLHLLLSNMNIDPHEMSISAALADYEPTWEVLILLCTGSLASFVVTISRSIQIGIYHRRNKSSFYGLRFLNILAALSNILAYVGFVILAIYPVDGDERQRHMVGAGMYFGLSSIYSLIHTFLLWKQIQYSVLSKIVMTAVPLGSVGCSFMFAIERDMGYQYEWFAVALQAVFIGLFTILFLTDRVDDELREYFCCR